MTWVVVLIFLGIVLLLVEILLIPGVNVAGIVGFILMAVGVYLAYTQLGTTSGHVALAIAAVSSIVMLVFALRANTWKRVTLNESIDSKAGVDYRQIIKTGDHGITLSRLAPMGKATINDQTVEVTAIGELIDQQQEVVVVKVEENKIIVKLNQ